MGFEHEPSQGDRTDARRASLAFFALLAAASGVPRPVRLASRDRGGLGLLIGDSRLTYAPERALETFNAMSLTPSVTVSLNYQHIENPAYNRDRGPADLFATRLHADCWCTMRKREIGFPTHIMQHTISGHVAAAVRGGP